ncbi:MAG: hypothetical protein MZU97_02630 [Bacillus subtilis]|nr:hypothetical protein [Bacillus subtilis]
MGSYSPAPVDLAESLEMLKNDIIKVDMLATVYDLDNIGGAIDDTVRNRIIKAFIKI